MDQPREFHIAVNQIALLMVNMNQVEKSRLLLALHYHIGQSLDDLATNTLD